MDSNEFRSLLLLLKGDLQEKNISHHTTITQWVLDMNKEHIKHLSDQMLVNLSILLIVLS